MSHYTDTYGNDEPRTPSESFVIFGTAFPEQTERDRRAGVSDAGQFVPEWKQEVRDEKGRRRFHGAFTGGFSAGYFNTVGSKEGWTPSSFVSSRSSRIEQREARPEDFMDEEDLEELASARKLVATDEFDILGGTQRELQAKRRQQQEDEARGGVGFLGSSLMDMVAPTKESVGIRLLQKLGWKPGQGIGPRMTSRQRRMTFHHNQEDEEDEDMDQDITFAPRDTPIENYTAKTNTFGLGYELEKYVPQVAEMRRLRELQRGDEEYDMDDTQGRAAFGVGTGHRQAGFGLGAFEQEDDDDADVYGNAQMKDYHYTLYEDDTEGDFLRRERSSTKETTRRHVPESINKTRCSDGRLPIKGFSVSNEPQELGKWYRPPEVPSDFVERHAIQDTTNTASAEPRYNMTSDERGAILGEKPTEPRSVFDYIPSGSKDQLDSVLKFMTHKRPVDPTKLTDFPKITKQQANMALQGFMPFGDNPKKQARYKSFLEDQAGVYGEPKDVLPVPEGLSHEEASKELDEFVKAARIFRPISAMMSGRFTSASANTTTVEQVSFQGGLKTEDQWRKEKEIKEKQEAQAQQPEKEKSQEAQAAAMKMFGQLTRTVKPFYPARLLCKRFNVRNPHPDHDPSRSNVGHTMAGSKEALSEEKVEDMMRQRGKPKVFEQWANDPTLSAVIPKPSERTPTQSDNNEIKEASETTSTTESAQDKQIDNVKADEDQEKETYERPSMDIFKAIFENSEDEDEQVDERDTVPEPANAESQGMTKRQPTVSTTSRHDDSDQDDDDDVMVGPLPPPAPPAQEQPSVPKFTRASERQSESTSRSLDTKMNVVSESIVVQPFKTRERARRRRVSVSEEEESDQEERKSRHKKKHKKEERRHKKEKKKKEKSRRKHSKHHSSDEDMLDGAVWVEKDVPQSSHKRRARATDLW
ncbi:hypothetical protein K492DRAFT_155019 [Lichtheimia hyalospora FSU 10163]|nr:hypothetical protein K492DRAFT_155019 [Lichtheimia hyalospora FSU 10163]